MKFNEKVLVIPGLSREYRLLHITDSHINMWDSTCTDFVLNHYEGWPMNGMKFSDFVKMRADRFTIGGIPAPDRLKAVIDAVCESPEIADGVIFTGDMLDVFTECGLNFVKSQIKRLPVPFLFTMGNHDMLFSNMTEAETRVKFLPLCGKSTEVQKLKVGELTIVGIDDTRNDYTDEAMSLFSDAIKDEASVILCQHVPLFTKAYSLAIAEHDHKDNSIGGERVPDTANSAKMRSVIADANSPIRALICGDCHTDTDTPFGDIRQITSACAASFF